MCPVTLGSGSRWDSGGLCGPGICEATEIQCFLFRRRSQFVPVKLASGPARLSQAWECGYIWRDPSPPARWCRPLRAPSTGLSRCLGGDATVPHRVCARGTRFGSSSKVRIATGPRGATLRGKELHAGRKQVPVLRAATRWRQPTCPSAKPGVGARRARRAKGRGVPAATLRRPGAAAAGHDAGCFPLGAGPERGAPRDRKWGGGPRGAGAAEFLLGMMKVLEIVVIVIQHPECAWCH